MNKEQADSALIEAVRADLEARDLIDDNTTVVDVVVVVSQRGFDDSGRGITSVAALMPGNTPGYSTLGLLAEGTMQVTERLRQRFNGEGDDDE